MNRGKLPLIAAAAAFPLVVFAEPLIQLPILAPGSPLGNVTTMVTTALPSPLTSSSPLPLDLTVLETGANGSGVSQVLALGSGAPQAIIGDQLNNTVGTPLLGLPTGTAQPIDVAVLGGDGTGNANSTGLLGLAALSGSNTAQGGALGVGVLNDNNTGSGSLIGIGALSGSGSGTSSDGLGVSALNRGDALTVTAAGTTVLSLADAASTVQSTLPGLDQGGIALFGSDPVTSSNPLVNAGVLTGDNAGNGGLIGVAALSGENTAQAGLVGIGALNGSQSANAPIAVDLLSGSGSGVSANGVGVAVLSGDGSGQGGAIGAGVLSGDASGVGGAVGAGVLSGSNSGQGGSLGAGVLAGPGSGNGLNGGGTGLNVAGGGSAASSGGSNGSAPNGSGTNGNFAYTGDARVNAKSGSDPCKVGYRDASGKMVRPFECSKKGAGNT